MKYKYLLFAILSFSVIIFADDILPGGFALPDIQSTLAVPANNVFQIRKLKTAYLAPDATGKLSLTLECGLIGRYTDTLRYAGHFETDDQRESKLHVPPCHHRPLCRRSVLRRSASSYQRPPEDVFPSQWRQAENQSHWRQTD